MDKKKIVIIFVILFAIGLILMTCEHRGSKSDIAYDSDGFGGYSDSFWEWYADNN